MRSKYVDYFNHDEDADDYDEDVKNEIHPIRTGYAEALKWIGSSVSGYNNILDLGSGTVNTIINLPIDADITAVDISTKMLDIAKSKIRAWKVEYIIADVLEFAGTVKSSSFNAVVSSFVLHHLTDEEKEILLSELYRLITQNGIIVIVDLMYENKETYKGLLSKYKDNDSVHDGLTDEFYWNIEETKYVCQKVGFSIQIKRFSELNWGIILKKSGV